MSTSDAALRSLLALSLLAGAAQASRRFPPAVQAQLGLGYTIRCSLCHVNGNTGPGTANTPFSISARARGLTGGDTHGLRAALALMSADGVDSDGDGVGDIAELLRGTDPNVFGAVPIEGRVDPSYGCASAEGGVAALFALVAAIALRRRRHRQSTGPQTRSL